jgi:hypothetical protein
MELIIINIKRQVQSLLPGSLYDTNHYVLGKSLLNGRLSRFLSSLSHDFGGGSETCFTSNKPGEMVCLCQENVTGAIASRIPDLHKYDIGLKTSCNILVKLMRNFVVPTGKRKRNANYSVKLVQKARKANSGVLSE